MKKVEIGKAIGYGWESIKKDLWYFVGLALVFVLVGSISTSKEFDVFDIISFIASTYLTTCVVRFSLDYYDGKKDEFADLLKQGKYFWRALGASILIGLIVFLGMIILIIPGIYWALKYQFVINLIVDKDLSIGEAMKQSGELTKGIKLSLLAFNLVLLGVIILGAIALGVGVLVAIPIVWLADVYVYRKLQEAK